MARLQSIGHDFIENNVFDINNVDLTFNSKSNLYRVKDCSYIRILIPMPIRRFSSSRFPGFCQFRMEKKEFATEMKTLHDFPYFLIISGLLTCFELQQDKCYLEFKCSKSTTKTLEQDMKHVYS